VSTTALSEPAVRIVPDPVLPDFGGGCLTNVVPTIVDVLRGGPGTPVPGWMPAAVGGARQVVLLVLDGLGQRQLDTRGAGAPVLATGTGGSITSVAPSTTAAALTSLATGLAPAVHGTVG